nr:unnamed protein product [Callosobruchus analis]
MQWGSPVNDKRGHLLAEWLAGQNLIVINHGDTPTFQRGLSSSFIDITLATHKAAGKILEWKVIEEESLSDHRFIVFEWNEQSPRTRDRVRQIQVFNRKRFEENLETTINQVAQETRTADELTCVIKRLITPAQLGEDNGEMSRSLTGGILR